MGVAWERPILHTERTRVHNVTNRTGPQTIYILYLFQLPLSFALSISSLIAFRRPDLLHDLIILNASAQPLDQLSDVLLNYLHGLNLILLNFTVLDSITLITR